MFGITFVAFGGATYAPFDAVRLETESWRVSSTRRYTRFARDILRITYKLINPGVKFCHSAEAGFRHERDQQKAH